MSVRPGRPLGEVSHALLTAAIQGPAPMAILAQRAKVGYQVARFKVPALTRSGALVALTHDRPRLYGLPEQPAIEDALVMLSRSFWQAGQDQEPSDGA